MKRINKIITRRKLPNSNSEEQSELGKEKKNPVCFTKMYCKCILNVFWLHYFWTVYSVFCHHHFAQPLADSTSLRYSINEGWNLWNWNLYLVFFGSVFSERLRECTVLVVSCSVWWKSLLLCPVFSVLWRFDHFTKKKLWVDKSV